MIWLFGDSFSVPKGSVPVKHMLWSEQVAVNLNEEVNYHAQWGVSNEWIISQFMLYQHEFETEDKIILQLTSPERQWFFEEHESFGNFYLGNLDEVSQLTKEQKNAIRQYITYLDSDRLTGIRNSLYHLGVERLTQIFNHVQILVLPGWTMVGGVNGVLMDICNNEFASEQDKERWYDKYKIDIRPNHMSEENHKILAEKITEYFLSGTPIDLLSGFEQGFLKEQK